MNMFFIALAAIIVILAVYAFYRMSKPTSTKVGIENESPRPLVGEVTGNMKCNLYKLEDTSTRQPVIQKVVDYDNTSFLIDRDFLNLNDTDIIEKYPNGEKIWQYDDQYGIRDFLLGDALENGRFPIYAKTDIDNYDLIGYIPKSEASNVYERRNDIESIRLIYYGGNYKFVTSDDGIRDVVKTDYENYVLTLAICYNENE